MGGVVRVNVMHVQNTAELCYVNSVSIYACMVNNSFNMHFLFQCVGWSVKMEVLLWKQTALNVLVHQATLVITAVKILMSVGLDRRVRMVVPA